MGSDDERSVVLWLTLGERSGWGWISVGTVIVALSSQVSALRQPGLPKPTWVYTGLLLVTLYCMGMLPDFWEAAVAGPALVIAPGYWVALGGVVVLLLGSLVRNLTALRAGRQDPTSTADLHGHYGSPFLWRIPGQRPRNRDGSSR